MYNILIVDDEEMIRKLIRKYAEFEGQHSTDTQDHTLEWIGVHWSDGLLA